MVLKRYKKGINYAFFSKEKKFLFSFMQSLMDERATFHDDEKDAQRFEVFKYVNEIV